MMLLMSQKIVSSINLFSQDMTTQRASLKKCWNVWADTGSMFRFRTKPYKPSALLGPEGNNAHKVHNAVSPEMDYG
jgi:hypothetical protein